MAEEKEITRNLMDNHFQTQELGLKNWKDKSTKNATNDQSGQSIQNHTQVPILLYSHKN